jgi:hypothetical protein
MLRILLVLIGLAFGMPTGALLQIALSDSDRMLIASHQPHGRNCFYDGCVVWSSNPPRSDIKRWVCGNPCIKD